MFRKIKDIIRDSMFTGASWNDRESGLQNMAAKIIENCGHYSADEQPEKVAAAIREFVCNTKNNM